MRPVLIVDDDPDIRQLLADLLTAEGYRIVLAANGRDALEHLRTASEPYLVLLDLMMPIVDGYVVLREVESDRWLRQEHRIVVISASERLLAGRLPGADAVLPKPFDVIDLLDLVEMLALPMPPTDAGEAPSESKDRR